MKTIEINDCLRCPVASWGSDCGITHINCKLEGKAVNPHLTGRGSCYCPDRVKPPDWCPLPVKLIPEEDEEVY